MNIFNTVQVSTPPTSTFDLSHNLKLSLQMGKLVPILRQEVLPGDSFRIGSEQMLRMAPMISPVMHRIKIQTHFFFVPNRILWEGWEDHIIGKEGAPTRPYITLANGSSPIGSLGDYMGIPPITTDGAGTQISALPFAAYLKIFDEYFRSQQLQPENYMSLTSGDNTDNYLSILNGDPFYRGWQHDYFTGSLPTAQEGSPVTLPLTNDETIKVRVDSTGPWADTLWRKNSDGTPGPDGPLLQAGTDTIVLDEDTNPKVFYDPQNTLEVDVNEEAVSINTLRRAFRLQEYFERLIRSGSRYFEWMRSMFNVTPSDARLQRPEYIGGDVSSMVISEVLSTANTTVSGTETPVGQMAGHGISVGGGSADGFTAEEHGFIIGLLSVMPDTGYFQGIDRCFLREDYLDHAIPIFGNIGEEEVKTVEIYADAPAIVRNSTFGYVPRFSRYRFNDNRCAGEFRDTLKFWHLDREFTAPPVLNGNFIVANVSNRIFAVTDLTNEQLYGQVYLNISANRRLPKWGTPTI